MLSRLNACLLNRGTERYNKLTHAYKLNLFSQLSGHVLEIGAGTGSNLSYYPDAAELTFVEPNAHMQRYLRENAAAIGKNIKLHAARAESLPFIDQSFDAVVSTLVLCSVDDLEQSLAEIIRVLKPGGTFHFIEHVAAAESTWLRTLQNGISPCWKCFVDGCHPNRETGKAIKKAGFANTDWEQTSITIPVVSPHIIGTATKAG